MKLPLYCVPVLCPDCGAAVPLGEVKLIVLLRPAIDAAECPKCAVGSPLREWRVEAWSAGVRVGNGTDQQRPPNNQHSL